MIKLQRITTEYVEHEDRIRVSGEGGESRTVVLWLTQRMFSRLVPHLCAWLERQAGTEPAAQVLQEFAQHRARAQLTAQSPVRASAAGVQGVLVVAVDLAFGRSIMALKFKDQHNTVVASLQLQATPLRQWLNMVFDHYQRAGWPMDVWPLWVTQATQLPGATKAVVLH